jgi:hypothetical protein
MLWIRPLMPRLPQTFWLLCALAAIAAGCKPKIGDDCRISRDCSAAADRLCDTTSPGGYCTIYNCEPGTCPDDESLCVEFGAQRSTVSKCVDLQSPSPYARAFCMATCEDDGDCRSGYSCEDLSDASNPWGAVLIDGNRGNRACVVPISRDSLVSEEGRGEAFGDVCRFELPPAKSDEPSSSGGTASGVAGQTAAGGDATAAGQGGAGG